MGQNETERPQYDSRASGISQISKLTSEMGLSEDEERCKHCESEKFEVRMVQGERVLGCGGCGREVGGEEGKGNKYSRFYT